MSADDHARRALKHYCGGCKRMVPHAPGLEWRMGWTIGVAHVVQEPMMFAAPCRPQRTYALAEQAVNLQIFLRDLEDAEL